jgi:hypothetical protein
VRLVEDHDAVPPLRLQGGAHRRVKQVVVRHEQQLGALLRVAREVERADLVLAAERG